MGWFKRLISRYKNKSSIDSEDQPQPKDAELSPQPENPDLTFDPDRPILHEKQDLLGFDQIARKLTTAILSGSTAEGLVIGIEGAWGSGKSSILNLICEHAQKSERVTLIKFSPWLIGSRDEMVRRLIFDMATAVDQLAKDGSQWDIEKAKALAKKLKGYGAALSKGISPLLEIASLFVPGAGAVKAGSDAVGKLLSRDGEPIQLSELKDDLIQGLGELNHRFIVTIDDIDRLEPQEVNEIVRLIRAVGDFPNVIYLVCYDKDILAHSLETALKIKNGKSYLQKIVQVSFSVPVPEEFDLRRWLRDECEKLYHTITGQSIPTESRDRFSTVCDTFGGTIETPRAVRLVLNSLRLFYPPVADEVDFSDICFLQIIRTLNEDLYKWIERYLTTFAAVQNGAVLNDHERKTFGQQLLDLMPVDGIASTKSIWMLSDYILGLEAGQKNDPGKCVFNTVSASKLTDFENLQRLSSPQHYRYYFSFSRPSGALDNSVIDRILSSASADKPLKDSLLELIKDVRPQGGTMFEVFLDRLSRSDVDKWSTKSLQNLLLSMADVLDEANRSEREPGFFEARSVWRQARLLFGAALRRLRKTERKVFLKKIFTSGESIGWLLAEIVGAEMFDHGDVGTSSIPVESRKLTTDELAEAKKIILKRLGDQDREQIINVPQLLTFLYRWQQAGGTSDVNSWITEQSRTDPGFLKLLNKLRGWRVSDKVYHPLNKRDVKYFMDYELAIKRLEAIAAKKKNTDEWRIAQELVEAAKMGKDEF